MSSSEIEWSSFNPVGNEAQYLQDAFASGWVSAGSYVEKLESELDRVYAGSHSFAVSNGTSALQLAFQTLGVEPGDQVIVPAFCFQAAGNILSQLGAKPVFCDIDSVTWNQTLNTIQRAITEKVVGIVIVHNYGRAAPSAEIVAWAKDNGLWGGMVYQIPKPICRPIWRRGDFQYACHQNHCFRRRRRGYDQRSVA